MSDAIYDDLNARFDGAPKDLHWLVTIFEEALDAKDAELASLRARPQEPRKCPTNHTCIDNYDENGDITTILWSDESIDYAFCPDCGAALREESE
jgi:hypothetical protein